MKKRQFYPFFQLRIRRKYYFLYGFAFILIGSMSFWTGYHNVDLSRNLLMVAYIEKLDYYGWIDTTLGGNVMSLDNIYRAGCNLMIFGYFLSVLGTGLLIYSKC